MHSLKTLDLALLNFLYKLPFRRNLFIRTLIFIGDGPAWMLVLLLLALTGWWLDKLALMAAANLMVLGLTLGNFCFVPFKKHVPRRRPYANPRLQQKLGLEIINRDPDHGSKHLESFPSGHVTWTTICVGILCSQFGEPALLTLGWLIPAMVILRPYLGVHYPSDALGGLLLGSLITVLTLSFSDMVLSLTQDLYQGSILVGIGYWLFLAGFLAAGFKSWLKRV